MSQIPIQDVKQGDLITADFMNQILRELRRIQDEVDSLTGGQPDVPIISALIPGGDVPEQSLLQILGRNFATPAILNTVTLDGVPVTGFQTGSSDTVLRVTVPGGIPGLPKTMTLTVTTARGSAFTNVRILPVSPNFGGQPTITNITTGLPVITPGQPLTFTFLLDGSALIGPEDFTLATVYANATPAGSEGNWLATTSMIGSPQIRLTPGEKRAVQVRATAPAAGATSVVLSLVATSVHNSPGSDGRSAPVSITIGQAGPNSDPNASLSLGPLSGISMRPDGTGGLQVRFTKTVQVPIAAVFQNPGGTYTFSAEVQPSLAPWTLTQPVPQTFPPGVPPGDRLTFTVGLGLPIAAPAQEGRTLVIKATRQDAGGAGPVSFTNIPISGFLP
jgi:hypothetical protein